MQFLDPRTAKSSTKLYAATVGDLKGARLAYVSNGWMSMNKIGKRIEGPLKTKYGVSEVMFYDVPRNMEPPGGLLDDLARDCDAAIVGIAN
ncbi:MAG: hypothetical protein HY525_04310 [Betaproteobacteria bacterium]|nr:hypothetical protein [Betaproteobacteria bacterium]